MTLVAAYSQANARMDLTTTGLATAGAAIFSIQRGPTASGPWTGVRGAVNQRVLGNGAQVWSDYEFDAGVTNYYRVVGQSGPSFIGVGSAVSGSAADPLNLSPTWHASTAVGDVLVLTLTGNFTAPENWPPSPSGTGWTLVYAGDFDGGSVLSGLKRAVWVKRVLTGESGPTAVNMTFFGMAGLGDGQAQIATFRYVKPVVLNSATTPSGSQPAGTTTVRFPALAIPENFAVVIAEVNSGNATGWTSVAASSGFTMMSSPGATRASLAWQYQVQGVATNIVATDLTITGSTHAASVKSGITMALSYDSTNAPASTLFTDNEPAPLVVVWLKDPLAPSLNKVVQTVSPIQLRYVSRSGLFDIKGRAEPIEISEIRRTASWTQGWVFTTFAEYDALMDLFASGRTLFLQVPARGTLPNCPPWPRSLPGGYISVGDLTEITAEDAPIPGTLTASVQVVAAPAPELDVIP